MKISPVTNHGNPRWKLDYYVGSKRKVLFFGSRIEAEAEKARLGGQVLELGEWWAALSRDDRNSRIAIEYEIEQAGHTLRQVWDAFRQNGKPAVGAVTLDQAIAALLESRRQACRREATLSNLNGVLSNFAKGRGEMLVSDLTASQIEAWLPLQAVSRLTYLSRMKSLLSFCLKRGWVVSNVVDSIDRPTIEQRPAQILTADDAEKLVRGTQAQQPELLPWLVFGLFCGLRPQEADKLGWESVDLEAGVIRLDAAASKVRRRRLVHLMPNAVEWLKVARQLSPEIPICFGTRRKKMPAIKESMGWKAWPKDILRHTAASNLLAHHQDAGKVAHELGNSVGVLLVSYKELVSKQEAEKFWAIKPISQPQSRPMALESPSCNQESCLEGPRDRPP